MRIGFSKPQRETTNQVTLDALKLSPCYPAFLITAEVPEICPRLPNQDFVEPPSEEEMVPFIKELGYTGKYDMLSEIHIDHMHQPWRTFDAVINRCIFGKSTGLDRLRLSRAQILWEMFYKKNVNFVALLWEDFMFQADNREICSARKENMPYPRFTKVITSHFISKDKTIFMRNRINLHAIRDDSLLGTLKYVSKTQDYQKYGALIPEEMINQAIKDSKAYKIYLAYATGAATPKKARKFKKPASPSKKQTLVLEDEPAKKPKRAKHPELAKKSAHAKEYVSSKKPSRKKSAGFVIRDTLGVSVSKKKAPAKVDRGKGMDLLSDVALLEAAQLKKVPDELQDKTTGTNKGTGTIPGVPDVPKDQSESENESWGESGDDDDKSDDDEEETQDDEYVHTPEHYVPTEDEMNNESNDVTEEEYERINEELYGDVNVSLIDAEPAHKEKDDEEMTYAGQVNVNQEGATTTSTTAVPDSKTFFAFHQRITNLVRDVKELKIVDHSAALFSTIKFKVPNVVKEYLVSSLDDSLYKVLKKHDADIIKEHSVPAEVVERLRQQYVPEKSTEDIKKIKMKHARKQQEPKETITSSDTPALEEFDQKTTLFETMTKSKSFNKSPKKRALYHALMESIIEDEDTIDEGVADKLKKRKQNDVDKDKGPSAGSDQGLKRRKKSKDT
ncbi:hypothetical protein Tco_0017776 [Tanacetum coccineum]